jgi:hypothetical protein
MSNKRAHKTLTIEEKIQVLDQLPTKSYTVICKEFGIGRATITDMKKREPEKRAYKWRMTEMGVGRSAKVMKLGKDEELETALFLWFKQKREEGVPITGPIVQAKAQELHQRLHDIRKEGDEPMKKFSASSGWLWRFCQRHSIRQLSLQGEKLSANQEAADSFVPEFQRFVTDGGYSLDQVFHCDETGLYYKLLPQKSLAAHFEKSADGRKTQKERVTINACSNASGTIKLPLLLIGKSKNPRCFKNIRRDTLPVVYANQSNAWVNAALFTESFHQQFVQTVQKKLTCLGCEPKAVLLLDNCSAHPDEKELISADGKVIAKYLPPNVTSLIQPMDQGVLESLKRRYRRKILEELVLRDDSGGSIIEFLKGIHLLKVSEMIAASWDEIQQKNT